MDLFGYSSAIANSNSRQNQIASYNMDAELYNESIPAQEKKEEATIDEQTYIEQGKDAVSDGIASHRMYSAKVYGDKLSSKAPSQPTANPEADINAEAPARPQQLALTDRTPAPDADDLPDPIPEDEDDLPDPIPEDEDEPPPSQAMTSNANTEPDNEAPEAETTQTTANDVDDATQDLKGGLGSSSESIIETAGRVGGAALALGNLGMNLTADFDGQWHHMNGAEKAGNVLSSIGSGLDLAGVALGPEALPLVAVGGLISLAGGITGGIGDLVKQHQEKEAVPTNPENQPKQNLTELTTAAAGGATLQAMQ